MSVFLGEVFLATSVVILLVQAHGQIINLPVLFWTILVVFNNITGTRFEEIVFFHDEISIFIKAFILILAMGCVHLSQTYIKHRNLESLDFVLLFLLSLGGQIILICSGDLIAIYLSVELQSLCFYVLASSQASSIFGTEGGLKYFLQGALASAFLLLGASLVYGFGGSTFLGYLDDSQGLGTQLGILLFSWGLLFKIGIAPFHIWVPDVYEGVPTSIGIIFSVLPKISIVIAVIRIVDSTTYILWPAILSVAAVSSLAIGGLSGLVQSRTKRLWAYSTIAHGGFILMGLCCSSSHGFSAGVFYTSIYMITSLFTWGILTITIEYKGRTRHLNDFQGWIKNNYVLGFTTCLIIFSIAGIPPLGGFFAKWYVFSSTVQASFFLITIISLLISIYGLIYYLKVIKIISFDSKKGSRLFIFNKEQSFFIGIVACVLLFFVGYSNIIFYITQNFTI